MSPVWHHDDQKTPVNDWGSHVDRMIREAQARGEFDNLPGAGKPLDLGPTNPFGAEWESAFRVAKNAGAAPLWITLDKAIGEETEALQEMLERTARYLQETAARLAAGTARHGSTGWAALPADESKAAPRSGRWWPFGARRQRQDHERRAARGPRTLAELEAERQQALKLYLARAAELDKKIVEYNSERPRALTWLEKPRLLPSIAQQRFERACPAIGDQLSEASGR